MFIQQFYTNCLAEAAYYIESNGEAAVIDPLRDTEGFETLAKERGATIKYVFETHFHADFVSGHLNLARTSGAKIVYGPKAEAEYDILVAEDMQEFPLGDIKIQVLHTPGHTLESSCFLVIDEKGEKHSVFTGDTLFIGDVGRPDLAVKSDLSREDLARFLYRSIQEKLLPLDDEVIVYPGHGAGSQCGKSLSSKTQSTIGEQKKENYALQVSSEEEFIQKVTDGLNTPPQYFPKNAVINKTGYVLNMDDILDKCQPQSPSQLDYFMKNSEGIVLDSRTPKLFSTSHIPGSLNVGLDGFFAVWVGTLVEDLSTPIFLVTEEGKELETAKRLARVGYENIVGFLNGGVETWGKEGFELSLVKNMCPAIFRDLKTKSTVLDVRTPSEYEQGHYEGAFNVPLAELPTLLKGMNPDEHYYLYCKSGYRSVIASSILKRSGFEKITNVKKGYEGIMDTSKVCCCAMAQQMKKES